MLSNFPDKDMKQPAFVQAAFLFILILLIIILAFKVGISVCPSVLVLGIPCPLCGISRAFLAVASGDFAAAFYYHPLWPVILLSIVLFFLYTLGIIRIGNKAFNICCFILAAMLIVCFIARHIYGSPIVETHFDDSLLAKIHSALIR